VPVAFSLMLAPYPDQRWALARQVGVTHAVTRLPEAEAGEAPWDAGPVARMRRRFDEAGLELAVVEALPPLNRARLGLPGGEEEVDHVCTLVRSMGRAGIPILCWNWMAQLGWLRTSVELRTRGGALVTGYDHALMRDAPPTEAGEVDDERLWETLRHFLERVVPVAESAGVRLALHPDDPPLPSIRGVARIVRSREAMERALALAPSPCNGITYCQGNFAAMGADVPATIRRFGQRGQVHFVHFRDIRGTAERFEETFHDDGQTDMLAAMRAYFEVGFDGPMRPDHVPTMAGEANDTPGYAMLGRLFAIGYMRGLAEAAAAELAAAGA
jgi:mannonate dehydratase